MSALTENKIFFRKARRSPCGKDCPGRGAGCAAMCANWKLYESWRDQRYEDKVRWRDARENNAGFARLRDKRFNERMKFR